MYRIMDRSILLSWATDMDRKREQDAYTALAIACDLDAYARRLFDCADARLDLASAQVGRPINSMLWNGSSGIRNAARATALLERSGEAKKLAEIVFGCALAFERAGQDATGSDIEVHDTARESWAFLMAEGIFSMEMYGDVDEQFVAETAMVRDEVEDGRRERRQFPSSRDEAWSDGACGFEG